MQKKLKGLENENESKEKLLQQKNQKLHELDEHIKDLTENV